MADGWVLNASPVILLGKVGGLGLRDRLAVPTLVPEMVLREISAGLDVTKGPDDMVRWVTARRPSKILPVHARILAAS